MSYGARDLGARAARAARRDHRGGGQSSVHSPRSGLLSKLDEPPFLRPPPPHQRRRSTSAESRVTAGGHGRRLHPQTISIGTARRHRVCKSSRRSRRSSLCTRIFSGRTAIQDRSSRASPHARGSSPCSCHTPTLRCLAWLSKRRL